MTVPYSMVIQWSDEDGVYVVTLPEFGGGCNTHGATYGEAAQSGHELLESLIEIYNEDGRPLPERSMLQYPVPA